MKLLAQALMASGAFAVLASPASASDQDDMLAAAEAIYAPYSDPSFFEGAAWDMPIYSRQLAGLIRDWEEGIPEGELEELNSFDWLCQCQDFDPVKFKARFSPNLVPGRDVGRVDVKLNLGWDTDETQDSTLFMVKEGGNWVVLDILSETFPVGLEKELIWAIEDHREQGR